MARSAGHQDMQATIVEAAERLFSDRGIAPVAQREIAREENVNVGSVTYHFGDKLGIHALRG